mmetsp:Transcript_7888/g.12867  ORF Transcript_7888/g.12867 Transcript_7888/m.12867 type:complete len:256 (+) Transcript_7888:58-825(+)
MMLLMNIVTVLLCLAVVSGVSTLQQDSHKPRKHNQKHRLNDEDSGVQLSIAPHGVVEGTSRENDRRLMRQEALMQQIPDAGGGNPEEVTHSTPDKEITVSCGKHNAAECAACPQEHGHDWCNGDCQWLEANETCVDKPPTTSQAPADTVPLAKESQMSDDAIAAKLRAEQEAEEEEERKAREKFWATVAVSAACSSILVICCGLIAICFCLQKKKKAEPLLENEGEAGEEEDEAGGEEEAEGEGEEEAAETNYSP